MTKKPKEKEKNDHFGEVELFVDGQNLYRQDCRINAKKKKKKELRQILVKGKKKHYLVLRVAS